MGRSRSGSRAVRIAVALALAASVGTSTRAWAVFDDIEVSPRARAMGGAWVALRNDTYAVYHNPAGLAWSGRGQAAASYVRPFGYDFSSQSVAAASFGLPGNWGGLGLGVRGFGVDYLGKALTQETTVSVGHGFHLRKDRQNEFTLGWAVDVLSVDYGRSVTGIDPGSATTLGLNFGAEAVVRERTRVGFYALNVNNPRIGDLDKQELRRSVLAGVSYSPYPGVETALEIASELGETFQYRGGAEFELAEFLWARAGLKSDPAVFTAGLGFQWVGLELDYGFSTGGGVLEETHHVGIGYRLSEPR